jgi:flagellum-specific peptidoglycan hydrolase FlgJ
VIRKEVGLLPPASKPWWQQATALVSLGAGGVVTGLSFVPKASADVSSPASLPINLLALKHSVRPAANNDARLRSAIVNVANYYRQMAEQKSPAEMEAIIWQHDSIDGANHGASCAAFASLTLHLASQVVGQQSWVTGGSTYPWPLHDWADVRVQPNPASLGITSVQQDAQAHDRWHPLGDGYRPQPGDWVLFDGHVEVVTKYAGGVLHTVGGDSLPNFSVNAHQYATPLGAQGVVGFVNNGTVRGQRPAGVAAGHAGQGGQPASGRGQSAGAGSLAGSGPSSARGGGSGSNQPGADSQTEGLADIPGSTVIPDSGSPTAPRPKANPAGLADIPGTQVPAPRNGQTGRAARHHAGQGQHRQHAAGRRSASSQPGHRAGAGREPASGRSGADPAGAGGPGGQGPAARGTGANQSGSGRDAPGASGARAPRTVSVPDAGPGTATIPGLQVATHHSKLSGPSVPAGPYQRHQPSPSPAPVHSSGSQQSFINAVAPGAIEAQSKYGVPAAVTIAQAIEESGWGQSSLATNDHNLFGIKGSGPAGSDAQPTQEFQNGGWVSTTAGFAVYHNVAQSINDHGRLLATSGYYTHAMAVRHSPNAFADALTGVYATDPGYGAKLIGLMRQYNLYRYDVAGRGSAPPPASQPTTPDQPTATGGATAAGGASIPGLPHFSTGLGGGKAPHRTPVKHHRPAQGTPPRPTPTPTTPTPGTPTPGTPTPGASTATPSTPTTGSPTPGPTSPTPAPTPTTSSPTSPAVGTPTPGTGASGARTGTRAPGTSTPSSSASSSAPALAPPASAPATAAPPPTTSAPAGRTPATGTPGAGASGAGAPGAGTPATGTPGAGSTAGQPAIPGIPSTGTPASTPTSAASPVRAQSTPPAAAPAATAQSATAKPAAGAVPTAETMAVRRLATSAPPRARASATAQARAAAPGRARATAPGPARTAAPGRTRVGASSQAQAAAPARARAAAPAPARARSAPAGPARTAAPAPAYAATTTPPRGSARASAGTQPRRTAVRPASATSRTYQHRMPTAVSNGVTLARMQLVRDEPLYRDVATHRDISWKLLAACDWMQCKARPNYSAVNGEKLGKVNPDGNVYLTRSEALHQCAEDLADLALAVYQIDLTTRQPLSVGELANVFAAFRWGGLLRAHHTSAMEFPYSVAGLSEQHVKMRWPRIAEPNSPDKPGARFRQPFGAVPLVLGLHYPATV